MIRGIDRRIWIVAMPSEPTPPNAPAPGRFTLERLSNAFARLMGPSASARKPASPQLTVAAEDDLADPTADAAPVTPRMIVEGLLFVGAADGRPLASHEIAAHIRNVSPEEVDSLVVELNGAYQQDGAAYEIVAVDGGYRLQLRGDLAEVRMRFRGEVRAAKLTPAALEVLSVVAYKQPVTADDINRLRGSQSYAILAQLVRRQLVRVERSAEPPRGAKYFTTDRFNRLFAVAGPADLPRSEDLDDA
jgi:segregation and condensation protein B